MTPNGPADADPVAAAQEWLRRNGASLPPETEGGEDPIRLAETRAVGTCQSRPQVEVDTGADTEFDGPDADAESLARTIVLRKLAVQARTRHELAKALAKRQVPEQVAETVLDRFVELRLIDDEAFAHDWVESRQQRRHLSASALRRELQTKGVDRDRIDEALTGVDVDDERRAARALAEKKFRSMGALERDVQYRRLAGALARRGFSGSVSATVIAELLDGRAED